jgi:hypothetical protein
MAKRYLDVYQQLLARRAPAHVVGDEGFKTGQRFNA